MYDKLQRPAIVIMVEGKKRVVAVLTVRAITTLVPTNVFFSNSLSYLNLSFRNHLPIGRKCSGSPLFLNRENDG
jgi:hypothetical protein